MDRQLEGDGSVTITADASTAALMRDAMGCVAMSNAFPSFTDREHESLMITSIHISRALDVASSSRITLDSVMGYIANVRDA